MSDGLQRKLESLRPGAVAEPIADEDVTGLIALATEQAVSPQSLDALQAATDRMLQEAERTKSLLLSVRPAKT